MKWQPIETAPASGEMMGYSPQDGIAVIGLGSWMYGWPVSVAGSFVWAADGDDGELVKIFGVTHWAPMPDVPPP